MIPNAGDEQERVLIIGIGSPHGDDRSGWEVIDKLKASHSFSHNSFENQVVLRKAAAPHEILDWLDSDVAVHIIDSVHGQPQPIERYRIERGPEGTLQCRADREHSSSPVSSSVSPTDLIANSNLALPHVFETLSSKSSHQLDLISTLELAAVLGRTPSQMFLWTIAIEAIAVSGIAGRFELSPTAETWVNECVFQLSSHLNLKRIVSVSQ